MRRLADLAIGAVCAVTLTAAGPLCPSGKPMGRSGCCSHHGGVCGCDGGTGMQRCCDGVNSPSCRCGE
jgi:hypothetical protein